MTYLDAGIRIDVPSLDAARVHGDEVRHAENLARAKAQDVAAARKAADAIHAIAAIDFTPAVAAQIAAVLSARVWHSSWSHFDRVDDAAASLDSAHDTLQGISL